VNNYYQIETLNLLYREAKYKPVNNLGKVTNSIATISLVSS